MIKVLMLFSILVSLLALNDIKKKDDLADPLSVLFFISFIPGINIFILGMFYLIYMGEEKKC